MKIVPPQVNFHDQLPTPAQVVEQIRRETGPRVEAHLASHREAEQAIQNPVLDARDLLISGAWRLNKHGERAEGLALTPRLVGSELRLAREELVRLLEKVDEQLAALPEQPGVRA